MGAKGAPAQTIGVKTMQSVGLVATVVKTVVIEALPAVEEKARTVHLTTIDGMIGIVATKTGPMKRTMIEGQREAVAKRQAIAKEAVADVKVEAKMAELKC